MHRNSQPLPLQRQVEDLGHQIVRSRIFYDLWWQLQGEPLEHHLEGVNLYPDLFRFSRHAYLYAMIVQTMIAYDQRFDTLSLKSLLKQMKGHSNTRMVAIAGEKRLAAGVSIWRKLKVVRDECFAHRSRHGSYDNVWSRAAIRPRDIYEAQDLALAILHDVQDALNLPLTRFYDGPKAEAVGLLTVLQLQAQEDL